MKTQITKVSTLLFMAITLSSCMIEGISSINGKGTVVTETRNIQEDFNKVKIGQGIELYISQEANTSLVVKADENLQRIIRTEVKNGVLVISSKKNIRRAKAKRVYLAMDNITDIDASSGSNVVSEGMLRSTVFSLSTSSGARAKVEIDAETVTTSASSGASLRIQGKATYHTTKASSGASIKSFDLKSKNVTAKASSGANIDVYAADRLEAKASSGGDIDFKGNPRNISKRKSSGGSISSY